MKVMLVVARLNVGGVALNLVQTAHALREAGEDVLLVYGQVGADEGDMAYLLEQYRIPSALIPSLGRELSPHRDLWTLWQLWRLMRKFRPDVVHTHTAKAGFVGRWAAFLARIPARVHTFHGHVFNGYFGRRKTHFFLTLERLTARITHQIVTLSDSLLHELADVYHVAPRHRFTVIPLGLDLAPFVAAQAGSLRGQYAIPESRQIIAVVGRLVPIKNHRLFIEAAALALQKNQNLHFAIVGGGELQAEIEADIAARGLTDFFTLTGWQSDLADLYPDFDLVTITSDNEGTPVSLLEALAAGIPVVSTRVGGVADLLAGHDNWMVPTGDAAALSHGWLDVLATPPDISGLKAHVLRHYGLERAAGRHRELYKALMRVRKPTAKRTLPHP